MNTKQKLLFLQSAYSSIVPSKSYKKSDNYYEYKKSLTYYIIAILGIHYNIPYLGAKLLYNYLEENNIYYSTIQELQKEFIYKYHFVDESLICIAFIHKTEFIFLCGLSIPEISEFKTKYFSTSKHKVPRKIEIQFDYRIFTYYLKNGHLYKLIRDKLSQPNPHKQEILIRNNKIHSYDMPAVSGPQNNDWYINDKYIGYFKNKEEFILNLKNKFPKLYNKMLKQKKL